MSDAIVRQRDDRPQKRVRSAVTGASRRLAGHAWTIWPLVRGALPAPEPTDGGEPLGFEVADPVVGSVPIGGFLHHFDRSDTLVLLVHGLGGCADSRYLRRAARVAETLGLSCLRLNLRGSDRRGHDFYHAGLTSDLATVLASSALARFTRIFLLGYSLGGHLVLRFATETLDPRVRAVAAVCSPLDLDRSSAAFDRPGKWAYRRYVLSGLCDIYAAVAARRPLPRRVAEIRKLTKLRDFDRHVIVPRFSFASVEDYYRQASVAGRLDRLRLPALLVAVEEDPMVPPEAIRAAAAAAPADLFEVRWLEQGGHVSFPAALDLGLGRPLGLDAQVMRWLTRH